MSFSFLYSAKVLYLSQPLPLPDWLMFMRCSLFSSSQGYAGFIPRLTWINGVNYTQGVKEAMAEFARYQVGYIHKSSFKNLTLVLIHLPPQKGFHLQSQQY